MKIVIDIPEQAYELIKRNDVGTHPHNTALLTKWIADGTPLPKGHGRLIDADEFLKAERPKGMSEELWTMCGIYNRIGAMPTIVESDKEVAEE